MPIQTAKKINLVGEDKRTPRQSVPLLNHWRWLQRLHDG